MNSKDYDINGPGLRFANPWYDLIISLV